MERFYLYLMLTKPRERLILSWPVLSAEGKTLRSSSLIAPFGSASRCPGTKAKELMDPAISPYAARQAVIRWLEEPESLRQRAEKALYSWLSNEGRTEGGYGAAGRRLYLLPIRSGGSGGRPPRIYMERY